MLVAACVVQLGAQSGSLDELAFDLHRGHLIVVAGASGAVADLTLLLDTGASRTVIAAPLAAALRLRGRTSAVETFGRTMAASEVVIPELQFGSVRVEQHPVLVSDLSTLSSALDLARLDAIVGIDVLGRSSFAIDYRRRRFVLGARALTRHQIPLRADPHFPVVSLELGGERTDLIVDTGASHLVLFRQGGSGLAGLPGLPASSLAGPAVVRGLLLPEVRAGQWITRDLPVLLAEAPPSSGHRHGLLAPTVLSGQYVQFDFERRELGWER